MAIVTLTDSAVRKLTSNGKVQADFFDKVCSGLCLRVTREGKMTWSYMFTSPIDRKRARLKLGTYPSIVVAEARARAAVARHNVQNGSDPREGNALQDIRSTKITIANKSELIEKYYECRMAMIDEQDI